MRKKGCSEPHILPFLERKKNRKKTHILPHKTSPISSLGMALSDMKFQRMNSFDRGKCSRLITTMHGIECRLGDYVLFFNSHPSAFSRNKRQLASAIGIGDGVLALYGVEPLKATVGEKESRQNTLVRQMSGLINDTLALERNYLKFKGALEMMRSFDLRVAHLLKMEGDIQQVTVPADKNFAGLSSLMDGKVSMDLVSSRMWPRRRSVI